MPLASSFIWRPAVILLGSLLGTSVNGQLASDPEKLLAEADRLAFMRLWTRAEPLYEQARTAFREKGDKRNALYAEVGRLRGQLPTLAVPDVSDRLAAYLDDPIVADDDRLRLRVLVIKGETDEDLDPALSQRSWTEALVLAQKLGDAVWTNRARAELGLVAFLLGDTNTAIVNLGQSIKVAETTGDTSSLVRWLTLFGHGFVELNRPEQALDFYERALKAASAVPELQMPLMTYVGKADALVRLSRPDEAEQLLNAALDVARREGALGFQAELTLRLGLALSQRGRSAEALDAMTRATALARSAGANRIIAGIAMERARVLRSMNRNGEADAALREGITAARAMGERIMLPRLLAQLADLQLTRGRVDDAATLLEEADDIVEGLVTRASSPWARSRMIAGMDDVLVSRIRLEGQRSRGDPSRLFAILERARARSLVDLLNSRQTTGRPVPPEQRTVERRISALQLQLLRTSDRTTRQRLLNEILAAEGQLAPITTELWSAAQVTPRAAVSVSQVQRVLRPDELLLELALTDPASFGVAITKTDARLIRLPGKAAIEGEIEALLRAIEKGLSATTEAATVGSALLGGIPNLGRFSRLLLSADGATHLVPFDLIVPPSGTPLLETHVVSHIPSASTLVALRNRTSKESPTQMALAVGASPADSASSGARPNLAREATTRGVYDVDAERLRPLPSAADEARVVLSAFPGRRSTALVGNEATEQAVKAQALATFRLVHFAAHGIVSTKVPSRSAIVLLPGSGEDGLLQAGEILDLRLSVDLVTLSACDTGTGTVHGLEGVASLVRPFLAAGARTVVANLWAADDEFSLGLMREFYRQLADGADVGEGLRQAKLRMRQQFGPSAVPKLWSGVLVSGDSSVVIVSPDERNAR